MSTLLNTMFSYFPLKEVPLNKLNALIEMQYIDNLLIIRCVKLNIFQKVFDLVGKNFIMLWSWNKLFLYKVGGSNSRSTVIPNLDICISSNKLYETRVSVMHVLQSHTKLMRAL